MLPVKGYAAHDAVSRLVPWNFERRDPGPLDVQVEILYCGVCHSDIHQARNEWNNSNYPMVPGHEIIGKVVKVGEDVKRFKPGDLAGVGVIVDSCRVCNNCKNNLENYCEKGAAYSYNSFEMDRKTPIYGGYSNQIVTTEDFVFRISDKLPLPGVAPLLCAGITTYSPLRYWKVGTGHKVGVLGLGGLGHMAVKFASSFGAEVTMLSTSPSKEADAMKLGAHHFLYTKDTEQVKKAHSGFNFIVDTVSAPHNYNMYLDMLKTDGVLICVGIPPTPIEMFGFSLLGNRRSIGGSSIGGLKETQEMLDYCAENNIVSEVEIIAMKDINEAYERMIKGDVKYRFVIDMATLNED
jgi:uncharacterized zinc-type alcohol dehydrogenase-like protein